MYLMINSLQWAYDKLDRIKFPATIKKELDIWLKKNKALHQDGQAFSIGELEYRYNLINILNWELEGDYKSILDFLKNENSK